MIVRLNPVPWLFAPGIGLAGWYFDGLDGAVRALAAWAVIVAVATCWVVVRRRWFRRDAQDRAP